MVPPTGLQHALQRDLGDDLHPVKKLYTIFSKMQTFYHHVQ